MKRSLMTMTFAAAAVLAVAANGSAQTMKAEIPFAFNAGPTRLPPGTYQLHYFYNSGASPMLQIYSYAEKHGVLLQPVTAGDVPKGKGSNPMVSFACTEGHCTLAKLWDGGTTAWNFRTPKPGAATRLTSIVLRSDRGE
jgi:hypothetical protein